MLRSIARVMMVGGLLAGAAHASEGPVETGPVGRPSSWLPVAQLKAAAHEAGLNAIFQAWQSYTTSTTAETYPAYYGRYWDQARTPTSAAAAPAKDETKKVTAADPARFARIAAALGRTRAGRDALDVLTRHGVRVEFIAGSNAGYFSPPHNLIAIGELRPDTDVINTLLHEINHALTRNTGKAAHYNMTRQDYVDANILDEARSDALVATAAREFARINRRASQTGVKVDVAGKTTTKIYLDAYKQVIAKGRAARQGKPVPRS